MAIYKPHTALVSRAVRNKKFEMQSAHFHDANEVYYLVDGKTNYLVADRLYQLTAVGKSRSAVYMNTSIRNVTKNKSIL